MVNTDKLRSFLSTQDICPSTQLEKNYSDACDGVVQYVSDIIDIEFTMPELFWLLGGNADKEHISIHNFPSYDEVVNSHKHQTGNESKFALSEVLSSLNASCESLSKIDTDIRCLRDRIESNKKIVDACRRYCELLVIKSRYLQAVEGMKTNASRIDMLMKEDRELLCESKKSNTPNENEAIQRRRDRVRVEYNELVAADMSDINTVSSYEARDSSIEDGTLLLLSEINMISKESIDDDKFGMLCDTDDEDKRLLTELSSKRYILEETIANHEYLARETYRNLKHEAVLYIAVCSSVHEHEWWRSSKTLNIDEMISRATRFGCEVNNQADVPCVAAILLGVFSLAENNPGIHDQRIHEFIHNVLPSFPGISLSSCPMVEAHISYLLHIGEAGAAKNMIVKYLSDTEDNTSELLSYINLIGRTRGSFSGTFRFSSLSANDMYLAGRYSNTDIPRPDADASVSYGNIDQYFSGANSDQMINKFKVEGLQPRIAEIIFKSIYNRIYNCASDSINPLTDMNIQEIYSESLPPADFIDASGIKYDVKCNLYYRSRKRVLGMRGLLIKINSSLKYEHRYPGIIFTNSDDDSVTWTYIGEYRPRQFNINQRVLPYYFAMPESVNNYPSLSDRDYIYGLSLLNDPLLQTGWTIYSNRSLQELYPLLESNEDKICLGLYYKHFDRCMSKYSIEVALWWALTVSTLEICCSRGQEVAIRHLRIFTDLISSNAIPVTLPTVENEPLILHWVTDVLKPLVINWSKIVCRNCGQSASTPGIMTLTINRMTDQGTIYGTAECKRCGHKDISATILTHCHVCSHYPLILGKNKSCTSCQGLICDCVNDKSGYICGYCKRGCSRTPMNS